MIKPIQENELQAVLNCPDTLFNVEDGFWITKLISTELEFKEFILRFGKYENVTKEYHTETHYAFLNESCIEAFEGYVDYIEGREDCQPGYTNVNVISHNQFRDPCFSLEYTAASLYKLDDIRITKKLEYPFVITVCFEKDFDRFGTVKTKLRIITKLNDILSGNTCLY